MSEKLSDVSETEQVNDVHSHTQTFHTTNGSNDCLGYCRPHNEILSAFTNITDMKRIIPTAEVLMHTPLQNLVEEFNVSASEVQVSVFLN